MVGMSRSDSSTPKPNGLDRGIVFGARAGAWATLAQVFVGVLAIVLLADWGKQSSGPPAPDDPGFAVGGVLIFFLFMFFAVILVVLGGASGALVGVVLDLAGKHSAAPAVFGLLWAGFGLGLAYYQFNVDPFWPRNHAQIVLLRLVQLVMFGAIGARAGSNFRSAFTR